MSLVGTELYHRGATLQLAAITRGGCHNQKGAAPENPRAYALSFTRNLLLLPDDVLRMLFGREPLDEAVPCLVKEYRGGSPVEEVVVE